MSQKEDTEHVEVGGILLPEQADAFIKRLIREPAIIVSGRGALPPIPRWKLPWVNLRRRLRYSRVRLAWEVLRGRRPSELHEDCW